MVIRNIKKYKKKAKKEEYSPRIDDIFDYREVLKVRKDPDKVIKCTNMHYGVSHILKRYSGYKGVINSAGEHGVYRLNELTNTYEYKNNNLPGLMVPSRERANFIREYTQKIVMPIGPSIFYAKNIYNRKAMEAIKCNLGKTLLVFPRHSSEDEYEIIAVKKFIEYVKSIQEKYDYETVLVCIYFNDMKLGLNIPYEREGWTIVSAGNRGSYDFNDCLRTIIELSDHVVNQGYSSNIGYSILLGKPVTYYEISFGFRKETEGKFRSVNENVGIKWEQYKEECKAFEQEYRRLFGEYTNEITPEQYEWCKRMFGYEELRSQEELYNYFMLMEALYRKPKKNVEDELRQYPHLRDIVVYNKKGEL